MTITIEKSDHSGLVNIEVDSEGSWQARLTSGKHPQADLDTLAIAVSEAAALIHLETLSAPGSEFFAASQERATSTFERILNAAHDIDFTASVANQERLREARRDRAERPVDPEPPAPLEVGPVTVTARDGFVLSVSFNENARTMSNGQLEQALGLALTQAVKQSVATAERNHDSRLEQMMRETITYRELPGNS